MARAARAVVDVDEGRLSTPQRALVLLTFLLVVAAVALFARQSFGDDAAKSNRRVTAAPRTSPEVMAPTTTAPVTTAAPDASPGSGSEIPVEVGSPGETAPPTGEAAPPTGEAAPPAEAGAPTGEAPPPPAPAGPAAGEASAPETPSAAATGPETPPPDGRGVAAWYVTFHGGDPEDGHAVNDVLAYDAEGAPSPTPVLTPGVTGLPLDLRELRAMAFAADGTLFVVSSSPTDGKVLAFGGAAPDGTRPFLSELSHGYPPNALNPGVRHPYGIAFDGDGKVLVTSQDSRVVTRLFGTNAALPDVPGSPAATASTWCPTEPCAHYPGTLAPATHAPADPPAPPPPVGSREGGLKSPRGVAYVSGSNTVYVADKADSSVKAYDAATGSFTGPGKGRVITAADGLSEPVGVAVHNGILYVADEGSDAVFALDLITPEARTQVVVPTTVGDVTLDHPSGLAFDQDGALYVASRGNRQVARYELSGDGVKARKAKVFLDDLPDEPEQIVAVPG